MITESKFRSLVSNVFDRVCDKDGWEVAFETELEKELKKIDSSLMHRTIFFNDDTDVNDNIEDLLSSLEIVYARCYYYGNVILSILCTEVQDG